MSHNETIERLKEKFSLQRHPADMGYLANTWRATRLVKFEKQTRHEGPRASSSSIYFLLDGDKFINWHMLLSDEFHYWHAGGALKIHLIDKEGNYSNFVVGNTLENEEYSYFGVVPNETWMAAERIGDIPYVFYSATSAPSWEIEDCIDGKRDDLVKRFPQHEAILKRFCIN